VCFTVDDPDISLLGRETIVRNNQAVGYLSSGGFGYTVDKSIGYGYVKNPEGLTDEYLLEGEYQLVVAEQAVAARIHLQPLYDPEGKRIKE